jgi:ABC-type multidrug transport system fused ATPase/permease subunit
VRILVRLLQFLRPYRWQVTITALAAAGMMACSAGIPYVTRLIIDESLDAHDRSRLGPLVLAIVALGVVRLGFAMTRRILAGKISLGVEFDLRQLLFRHLQRLSFGYFDRMPVGQLMSRATSDLQVVRFFLGYGLVFLFMNVFALVLYSVLLFVIDARLAALALLMGPGLVVLAWISSRRTQRVLVDVQQRVAEVTQAAEESIVGTRVIKAFGQEARQSARFAATANRAFDTSMEANRLQAFYQSLMGFLPTLGLAVVIILGGLQAIDGTLSLGAFVQFYAYLLALVFPFRMFGMLVGQAQRATASGRRIFEVLDTAPEIAEAPGARPLPAAGGGRVTFEDVHFAHTPGGPPVLAGVTLDVPAGRTIGLIGPTGSGKTTLTQLIPRYYDVSAGRLLVDGEDVRELRLDDLRRAVGVVSQEPFLFSATVRENIAYGVPDATDDEVVRAACMAQADAFVRELPDGYDTVVGERGYTLSGGQRQRIAIARAIITDPRVLILDEATASVDATTEREIGAALRAAMAGRTTFVIAHRLSTIALADEIVVLEDGRVAARGSHEELYATSDLYREIRDSGLARPDLVAEEAA